MTALEEPEHGAHKVADTSQHIADVSQQVADVSQQIADVAVFTEQVVTRTRHTTRWIVLSIVGVGIIVTLLAIKARKRKARANTAE